MAFTVSAVFIIFELRFLVNIFCQIFVLVIVHQNFKNKNWERGKILLFFLGGDVFMEWVLQGVNDILREGIIVFYMICCTSYQRPVV